jgi:Ca2+-binding RTX toxin-like protein
MAVTVPGTGGSTITIPTSLPFEQFIAQQIANALAAAKTAGDLAVTAVGSGGTVPASTPGSVNELVVTGGGGANNVPAGYSFIVNDNTSADSISGTNTAILSGSIGGTFWVSGNSTVAGDGTNIIVGQSGGTYLLSTNSGNDSIFSSGGGTIAGGAGANLLWAADGTDTMANLFVSDGIGDTIVAGAGADTVAAYGSKDLIYGGSGPLVVGSAPNSTISSGSGPETIFGSSGNAVFANNSSGILFLAGTGPSTVVGGTNSLTTVFGSSGSAVTFANSATPGGILVAGAGNETLNAGLSNSNNTLSGAGTGADSLAGGSGNDVFWAGAGPDTLTGGGGSDAFNFVHGSAGGTDVITDFSSNDVVNLIGYGANAAAQAIANATVSGGSTTIQLSDSTKITFLNVTNLSTTNVHSS